MSKLEKKKIRPYARLLTMLGEQLIKNELIALIELIKNAFDADADWVKVTFADFDDNYQIKKTSRIIIEDNGHGMSRPILENHWLNPATPEKKKRKEKKAITDKGRIIQGEKGIGRFAILKLGRKIDVITRPKSESKEYLVEYDFSKYDDEFLTEDAVEKELFIDDLSVDLTEREATEIIEAEVTLGVRKVRRDPFGTRIEISNLKGSWTESKVEAIYSDLAKLESIFTPKSHVGKFEVYFYRDNEHQSFLREQYQEKLDVLLSDRPVFKIEKGHFDEKTHTYTFEENGNEKKLSLNESNVRGLKVFKDWFGDKGEALERRKIECGSFDFWFYIFDFDNNAPPKYRLDREDKKIIKSHRVYLYRDGIRVYPYGDPIDDWLRIDQTRGTVSAAAFLSNDQVVGCINISQKGNPKLKDKTNREGLIEEGNATGDFVALIQVVLAHIRKKTYAEYRKRLKDQNASDIFKSKTVQKDFDELKNALGENKKAHEILARTQHQYQAEKKYLVQRAESTEELAGVGLSVETASHDIMGMMGKVFSNLDGIIQGLMLSADDVVDKDELIKELQSVRGGLSFIEAQLKDIQLLFKSAKTRRHQIRVHTIIDKVERIYKRLLKKEKIKFAVASVGAPLIAKTTDAVLLQLLLNLIDNAVYWLKTTNRENKEISIVLDGDKGQLIFSDNGPGIPDEDKDYIFDPFFSGKGDEGRGLGLYIARQLLERNDYSIRLAELTSERKMSGANFVVDFFAEE